MADINDAQSVNGPIRVAIADDQELVRKGFRLILSSFPGIQVVGEAVDGADAVALARRMHPDVLKTILAAAPQTIVYVSCNPASQARDLQVLCGEYRIEAVQPVDMFPHTTHVENCVLLKKITPVS